jgi:hypothetical protein
MTAPAAFAAQINADEVRQITVQASQKVKTKQVGVSYRGLPGSRDGRPPCWFGTTKNIRHLEH